MERLIQWFIANPIAANLLMVSIVLGGILSAQRLEQEVLPRVNTNYVDITMEYPGAGPREVEQQITMRIETALADIEGIRQLRSDSHRGHAVVTLEALESTDRQQLLNDIKARVDAVDTFPAAAERPLVRHRVQRRVLLYFALHGDVDETVLKEYGQLISDELAQQKDVASVRITGMRDDEISIEVSEENLDRYQLSFDQVAAAIRRSSLSLPAGTIETDGGDIQVQTRNQAYSAGDFARIVVRSGSDGSRLLLSDIADIRDGFAEQRREVIFNRRRALAYEVYLTDSPNLAQATLEARQYLERARQLLPPSMGIEVTFEKKSIFDDRLRLLSNNAVSGLILVFVVLMLFLRPLLAIWVCMSIVVAFCGAFWLMPYAGMSLNLLSMFAFLMVLGIVVDDAIVIGESIYAQHQAGLRGTRAAAGGAKQVGKPVVFAILSTVIFFAPMLDLPPSLASITYPIAVVVILCLLFSLIDSLFILPAHLANMAAEKPSRIAALNKLAELRAALGGGLVRVADNYYRPLLRRALNNNAATLAGFFMALLISVVVYQALPKSFQPTVPADFVSVSVTLPEGTPYRETRRIMHQIVTAGEALRTDPMLLQLNAGKGGFIHQVTASTDDNKVGVFIGMRDALQHRISSPQIAERLRELIGPLPEAKQYSLNYAFDEESADIQLNINVPGNDMETQRAAAAAVSAALAAYPGVFNVRDSLDLGRVEVELALKQHADQLGISLEDIARQVRQGFHGEEVQRIPRAREDVRVMLRYPEAERRSLDQLTEMRVRTAGGVQVPLEEVAEIRLVPGFTSIQRIDRRRTISISAEVENGVDPTRIVADLKTRQLLNWQREYKGFKLDTDGNLKTQQQSNRQLLINLLVALAALYALMAIAFRSYFQPLLVLTAIPFGFMGAVIGHKLLGHEVSFISQLGFLACAGVVINDNLVLLDRTNQLHRQGKTVLAAVLAAGSDRFRAITLTSLTTFIGLLPLLFEQSIQARFLIPMVISLSFGVVFATTVTLILVPCLYVMGYRVSTGLQRLTMDDEVAGALEIAETGNT
ncbi:efflux RND transporter permease subunit [Exilibacterium tricleocarpae]|uniref:Efflux RND transporter permease subunit n=1 Tax=Exilibacterium tricleocarpae TaxID=2591008 RepID=A0A545T1Q9_9GAMM|nr:efflux RND transporter permease subunit [Exilibacterium tricleocarpae]TQV71160.1 efflux RND transporter permease subunit [Exilibacterium tricleocarpae]